jgi:hypothetical protein
VVLHGRVQRVQGDLDNFVAMRYGTWAEVKMPSEGCLVFKGRRFTRPQLKLIAEVVASCAGLSRQELAMTVCELLAWRRPNGGLKTWECKQLLAELEAAGQFELPALRATKPRGSRTSVPRTAGGEVQEGIGGTVREVAPVSLRRLSTGAERRLWRELVGRYHYLGHTVPFGAHLRYLIEVARPRAAVVGCLQLSSPAWKIAVRDAWIGWCDAERRRHLQRVVANSRFLLLPWVEVRCLASAVLAMMARQFPGDWEQAYGVRPLLLETLVETGRYRGTCYRAANWLELGTTQGRGRMDQKRQRQGACPKQVFVYPLVKRARQRLRGEL